MRRQHPTTFCRRLLRDSRAATAIEYGLIVALIAIGLISSFQTLKTAIAGKFTTISGTLRNAS